MKNRLQKGSQQNLNPGRKPDLRVCVLYHSTPRFQFGAQQRQKAGAVAGRVSREQASRDWNPRSVTHHPCDEDDSPNHPVLSVEWASQSSPCRVVTRVKWAQAQSVIRTQQIFAFCSNNSDCSWIFLDVISWVMCCNRVGPCVAYFRGCIFILQILDSRATAMFSSPPGSTWLRKRGRVRPLHEPNCFFFFFKTLF